MISNDEGAMTSIHCATSPEVAGQDGLYYDDCREKAPNPIALDADAARRMWEESVKFTGADLS